MDDHLLDLHRQIAKLEVENATLRKQTETHESTIHYLLHQLSRDHRRREEELTTAVKTLQHDVKSARKNQDQWLFDQQRIVCREQHQQLLTPETSSGVDDDQPGNIRDHDLLDLDSVKTDTDRDCTGFEPPAITSDEPEIPWKLSEELLRRPVAYRNADGDLVQVPMSGHDYKSPSDSLGTHEAESCPRPLHVPYYYHQRLLNSACFTEDLSGADLDRFWAHYAFENGIQSPAQWRSYYEHRVRPVFLKKLNGQRQNQPYLPDASFGSDNHRLPQGTVDVGLVSQLNNDGSPYSPTVADNALAIQDVKEAISASQPVDDTGPSLVGTAHQLEEARQFLQSATKGRQGRPRRPCYHQANELPKAGLDNNDLRSSLPSIGPALANTTADETSCAPCNSAVLIQGVPCDVSALELLHALQPHGMLSVFLAKTAGMKTTPPTSGATLFLVFSCKEVASTFCRNATSKMQEVETHFRLGAPLSADRLLSECRLLPSHVSALARHGATCSILVDNVGSAWSTEQLVRLIRNASTVSISILSICRTKEGSVLFVFGSILMSWHAHKVLLEHANLEPQFVNPWDGLYQQMKSSIET